MSRRALAAAIALLASAAPASAKDPVFVEAKAVADKPAVALDPALAHVLLRAPVQTSLYLMKVPSAADQAAYDALRAEKLAKARRDYAKKLAAYERDRATAPREGSAPRALEKPIEPTEANFRITPFELMAGVPIGPLNRFAKGANGVSTYLHALTPGRYRVYGPITAGGNGVMLGACYCMGSVAFDAAAGEVVDVSALAALEAPALAMAPVVEAKPMAAAMPVDPRLAAAAVKPARFAPVGKLPNHFGIAVTRMPAMAGVMRYDRDRIVDLTGGR